MEENIEKSEVSGDRQAEGPTLGGPVVHRGRAKTQQGFVVSDKMSKSIVVDVTVYKRHPAYGKFVKRSKRYVAHDERNEAKVGDRVLIVESRPLSKTKRWRLQKIVERAE